MLQVLVTAIENVTGYYKKLLVMQLCDGVTVTLPTTGYHIQKLQALTEGNFLNNSLFVLFCTDWEAGNHICEFSLVDF